MMALGLNDEHVYIGRSGKNMRDVWANETGKPNNRPRAGGGYGLNYTQNPRDLRYRHVVQSFVQREGMGIQRREPNKEVRK